jgi:hypothetical protein
MKQINNLKKFIEARGFGEESFKDIERNTYKYTNCGAWIMEETENRVDYESPHIEEFNDAPTYKRHTGLTVGSIVEGADYDCDTVTVSYPFELDEFWEALKAVEDQAGEIWKDTHGCDKCWHEAQPDEWGNMCEFGAWPINKECKTCEGEGTII